MNDEPNNNGSNAKSKEVYSDKQLAWDEILVTTPFTPPHMNTILVKVGHPHCARLRY